ncbi:MAG: hypothetical protein WC707_00985 [Candidatus Babeliaceae bacterium]|jgi:hypothetical protein
MNFKILFLSLLSLTIPLFGMEMPANVKDALDAHRAELQAFIQEKTSRFKTFSYKNPRWWQGFVDGEGVTKISWLPGHYIKYHVNRVMGANILKQSIEKNKLTALDVPKKYLYRVYDDNRPISDENTLVIAEKIEEGPLKLLNSAHINQIICLHNTTGFEDPHERNLIRADDSKCYIIDTGGLFLSSWTLFITKLWYGDSYYLTKLSRNSMTEDARNNLKNEQKKCLHAQEKKRFLYTTIKTTAVIGIGAGLYYWLAYKRA